MPDPLQRPNLPVPCDKTTRWLRQKGKFSLMVQVEAKSEVKFLLHQETVTPSRTLRFACIF